jgi:CRP/FNR family transcriptional regulator
MNPQELKHITVLREMDNDALSRLAPALEEKTYADGQTVFAEGDPGDSMYFIVKGCVRIEKLAQATGSTHKTLAILEPGDYFGEMALFEQKPRSASAVAAGEVALLHLSKTSFDELQRNSTLAGMSVLFAMLRTSGRRVRWLNAEVIVYDQVGEALGEASDLQKLLDVILRQLSWATSADWGMLLLRSQFSEDLELRSQSNLKLTSEQSEAVRKGQGFLEPVLKHPQHQLVASLSDQEPFKSCPRLGFETGSLLLSPITLEGQLLGLIVLAGPQRAHFHLNALNLARGVARQAAQAIMNARHREEDQARLRHSKQLVRF